MTMFAGLLDKCIDIYRQTKVANGYGEMTTSNELVYSTRAKVSHISGSKTVINSEIQIPYAKTFVVRSYVPVLDDDLIHYNNAYWGVVGIDIDDDLQQKIISTKIVNE